MKKVTIMGILNVTPDSFSDGGMYYGNIRKAVMRVRQMLREGADIIDIGGESTRPGSASVTGEEELERVLPVIDRVKKEIGTAFSLSIDTYKAGVAEVALEHGATMVNSLGGFRFDEHLADVVKKAQCPLVIYHIQGLPKTMQKGKIIYKDVVTDISAFFKEQMALGIQKGIRRNQFIIDPGIGFGKSVEQNLEILKRLNEFKSLHLPILVGVSRKSHIGLLLQKKLGLPTSPLPEERLEGSLAETAVAVINGASLIRTHDVLQTKRFLTILEDLL